MRTLLALLAALAVLTSAPALAGEEYLGIIISGTGADTTNSSTATPFVIPAGSKITANCNAAAYFCTDTANACTATGGSQPGVPVASGVNFPTSTRAEGNPPTTTVSGKRSSIVRIFGAAAVSCTIWIRNGNE